MTGFSDRLHLKGKAEEDQYFAKLDRDRVAALHARNVEAIREKSSPEARPPAPGDPDKLANCSAATGS